MPFDKRYAARDILCDLIQRTWLSSNPKGGGPGAWIEKLSPEKRAVLAHLKSDDVRNMRVA